jgi:hypothetical protein
VVVEDLGPEVERAGLTRTMLQTDAELKLRQAGIRMLTKDEQSKESGFPFLYLDARVFQPPSSVWFFAIQIKLLQAVQLIRNPAIVAMASTWGEATEGAVGSRMPEKVRSTSKDLVDEFINAYLAVNPKK